jgi:hypothetical protein
MGGKAGAAPDGVGRPAGVGLAALGAEAAGRVGGAGWRGGADADDADERPRPRAHQASAAAKATTATISIQIMCAIPSQYRL